MHPRLLYPCGVLLALQAGFASAVTVANTILVIARDAAGASSASVGLDGYGIPFETLIVPAEGVDLPPLRSTLTDGSYGGFIIVSEVTYSYDEGWRSALTDDQLLEIFNYQKDFNVRMVRLDVFPGPNFGTTTAVAAEGCCQTGQSQQIAITNSTGFPTANVKTRAGVATDGLWHYPAEVTDSSTTWEIAQFAPSGQFTSATTAAVVNDFDGRQQMVFFISWAADWALTTNYLQHAFIHWMTRGVFSGKRKVYLNTQVDDMHLDTELYEPAGAVYRLGVKDLNAHKSWQANINTRLPSGSKYFIEVAHNGNGDIIVATDLISAQEDEQDYDEYGVCDPAEAVDYEVPADTALEFKKPLGTGTNKWPDRFEDYEWSSECAQLDPVASWFWKSSNRDVFAHVSHTFTHLELNNATYKDTAREIAFNKAWLDQVGISDAKMFSKNGLVPPAITGLHNGDAIRAWLDNGIKYVVGDNTRPLLRNSESPFWPEISSVQTHGYAGLVIIPRWATTIYYNCDWANCTTNEWINTSGGKGNFNDLLANAKATNVRYLLGLHPDPFMFHQANMRQADAPMFTVGSQTAPFSLLQIWVELITQEMVRLTDWPILSLKHDDIAQLFLDRMTLDKCNPNIVYHYNADASAITDVEVTADNNKCDVEIPVTLGGRGIQYARSQKGTARTRLDKVGNEPPIVWVSLQGSSVTLKLDTPVPL